MQPVKCLWKDLERGKVTLKVENVRVFASATDEAGPRSTTKSMYKKG